MAALALAGGVVTFAGADDGGRCSSRAPSGQDLFFELTHGYAMFDTLKAMQGQPDSDIYYISQKPFSSYEAVIDSTSGDIGPTLKLDRIDLGTGNVLTSGQSVGLGFSRSLRWMNATNLQVDDEAVRVESGQCTTDCGDDDVYFMRGYETTYSIPRFNNSGTQVTVLMIHNPTDYAINGNIQFWSTDGALLASKSFTVMSKRLLLLDTHTVAGADGVGGSITIANNGRYGDLSAKAVALEITTGFSFDSLAVPRLR